jgi:hypothetical protein
MNRLSIVVGFALSAAFLAAGCHSHDDCCSRAGYCNDSGCYACDEDGCWPVENAPCRTDGQICAGDETCTEYGCARLCTFETDCALGEKCLEAGYCGPASVDGDECTTDDDCAHGLICEGNVCIQGCQHDEECQDEGEGWVCTACGRCAPPESPTCGEWKTFCDTDPECGEGRVCTELSRCTYTCETTDPLCPLGQVCIDGECADDPAPAEPECVFSTDCTANALCTENGCLCVNSYCHPLCTVEDDCGWGEICDLGLCVANYRPEG